jgi:hypothetical protein
MALTNAEKQKRWRNKRNALARQAGRLSNLPVDRLVQDQIKRGKVCSKDRRLAVQHLLKNVDAEEDAELLTWLRTLKI